MTHPFHPLFGREFDLINANPCWGDERVFFVDETEQPGHGLLRDLVHATYWLDHGLQPYMREHAGMSLPRAQSMMMVYLAEGVDRPWTQTLRNASAQRVRQLHAALNADWDAAPGRNELIRVQLRTQLAIHEDIRQSQPFRNSI